MSKKSIDDILMEMEAKRLQQNESLRMQNQEREHQAEKARQEYLRSVRMYEKASLMQSNSSSSAGSGGSLRKLATLEIISYDIPENIPQINSITVNVTSDGNSPISSRGIVFSDDPEVAFGVSPSSTTIADLGDGFGEFTLEDIDTSDYLFATVYLKAYATNGIGTSYSDAITFEPNICLAKGTKILLSNGLSKSIEDIGYSDKLLVWNFDDSKYDESYPLWIKKEEKTRRYNLLKFNDGSELKTISQHRIFNKESGKFTYPMTNETPIGTTTFNSFGQEVKLISKEVINEEIEYYNVITNSHINVFANGILTSCRYNNIYPIENMKFIKDDRVLRNTSEFINVQIKYISGLRLTEQKFSLKEIESYVNRLIRHEMSIEEVAI